MANVQSDRDKRTDIIHGVWQVIATKGLPAVSVRAVAAAAGVSAGRVQHYFPTKADLVRASAEAILQGAEDANPAAQEDPKDHSTLIALLTHALAPASSSRVGTGVYYSYMVAAVADPWIAELLMNAKRGVFAAVQTCVQAQFPERKDAAARARELVCLSDGLTQAVFLGVISEDEAQKTIEEAVDRLAG